MVKFFISVLFRMESWGLTFPNILNQRTLKNYLGALIQEVALFLFLAFCSQRLLPLWAKRLVSWYLVARFSCKHQFNVCQNLNFEVKVHKVIETIIFFFSSFKVRDVSYRPPGTELSLLKEVNFSLPEKRYTFLVCCCI